MLIDRSIDSFNPSIHPSVRPHRLWTTQFCLSFACNVSLAFLFFAGALIARDHPPLPPPETPAQAALRESLARRNGGWCYRCVPMALQRSLRAFFQSEAFGAVRVYVKSSFHGGGVLSGGAAGSAWGRYAADAFLPAPVDLEGTTALEEVYSSLSSSSSAAAADTDKDEKAAADVQRLRVAGRGVKPWPSIWYLGWYLRRWCGPRKACSSALATQCCASLPWTLLIAALLLALAIVAFSLKAYLLTGFVLAFFILLPLLYSVLARTIHSSFMGLLLVDLLLIVFFTAAFFLSLSVSSYYLGYVRLLRHLSFFMSVHTCSLTLP